MASILDKLKKNCKIKEADVLTDSKIYSTSPLVQTEIPMLNVALSGSLDGGLASGLIMIAGPSKNFKSLFSLLLASAYLKKNPDATLLFYDSEFGTPKAYFDSLGIDMNRVLHVPIKNIEELKFDIVNQLEMIERKDKVIIVIDSVGNLASKKEIDDAINEKSVADMTRAKALKGLFRMTTPYLTVKDIPMIVVNHTYKEQSLYPKDIMSGGTGAYYSSSIIWFLGRQQDKDGTEIQGYHFIINVEKSRYVKEKSKIPISVSWNRGIEKWSGLLDVAKELGYIKCEKQGWYCAFDPKTNTNLTQNMRAAATFTKEFWETLFTKTDLKDAIKEKYTIGTINMIADDDTASVASFDADESYDDDDSE